MADEISQKLGLDASAAISSLRQLRVLFNQYAQSVRAAADANTQFNKTGRLITASLQADAAAMASAQKAVGQLTTQTKRLVQQLNARLAAQNKLNNNQPKTPAQQGSGSADAGLFASTLASNLLARAISGVTTAFVEGTTAAIEYELTLARIKTIAGTDVGSIQTLSEGVRALSDEFGRPIAEVAAGQYELLSNQIGSAAEATNVLRAALQLSNITGSTTADSVNAISSVINSYNLSTAEAETISAKLFRAVDLGRFTLDEVANSMGRVTVTAAQLGVSLDEVLGALATLTITGVPADEAMTLLSNTMRGLLKPTKDMAALFAELGVTSAEAGIQAFGFQGFLERLAKSSGGSASEIAQLTENVRVARGFLGLTGEQAERAAKNIEEIGKASAEFLRQKNEIVINTNAKQVQDELNEIKNLLLVDIGQNGLAVINDITSVFGGLSTVIKGAGIVLAAYVAGLILARAETAGLIGSNASLSVSFTKVGASAAATASTIGTLAALALPIAALAASVVILGGEFERASDAIKRGTDAANKQIELDGKAAADSARVKVRAEAEGLQDSIQQVQQHFIKMAALYAKDAQQFENSQKRSQAVFKGQINDRIKAYEQYVEAIKGAEKRAADIAKQEQQTVTDAIRSSSDARFERSIQNLGPGQQTIKQIERANQLLAESRRLEAQGGEANKENAQQLRQQAQNLAQTAAATANGAGNARQLQAAERAINDVLVEQISISARKEKAAKDAAAAASKRAAEEEANLAEIKSLNDQINDIQTEAFKGGKSESEVLATLRQALPLADQLQKKLSTAGDVDLAKQLGITPESIANIRKPFTDALSKPVDLKFAFDSLPRQIQAALSQQTFGINVDPKILQDKTLDLGKQITAGQTAAIDLGPATVKQKQAINQVTGAVAELRTQLEASARGIDTNANSAVQTGQQIVSAFANAGTVVNGLTGRLVVVPEKMKALGAQFAEISAEVDAAKAAISTSPDTANFTPLLTKLQDMAQAAADAKNANLQQAFIDLGEGLIKARDAQIELNKVQATKEQGEEAARIIEEQKRALDGQAASAGTAATNTGNLSTAQGNVASTAATATGASGTYTGQLSLEEQQAQRTAQANFLLAQSRSGGGGGGPVTAAQGKPIYRAEGGPTGFAPRGTDTIPAMLSPGEFVVNARSSRKFFSQLLAINAGRMPAYRANGGPVSNTTIGDVNVNVNTSDSSQIDGRMLANALRRELRRGTINLKG